MLDKTWCGDFDHMEVKMNVVTPLRPLNLPSLLTRENCWESLNQEAIQSSYLVSVVHMKALFTYAVQTFDTTGS